MLDEERERELAEVYANQCLWSMTSAIFGLAGADFSMPQYVEIIHPETKTEQQSAQDIKDHVVSRLLEG
ncbi:MAG: hypothetical protein IKQ01_06540 [Bacteroidales bacterium]|nr:hypothetical protein [Bacteroidales bacterium]